ncbi:MAG: NUDIX domain-containing protein [Polyangiaceae bacterium]
MGAVVLDRRGHVLLVCRGRPPAVGTWTLPGGRIESGESPDVAIIRELREETSLSTAIVCPLGEVILEREGTTFRVQEYLLVPLDDTVPVAGDDAADVRWVSLEDLEGLGVLDDAVAVIKRSLEVHGTIRYTPVNGSAR